MVKRKATKKLPVSKVIGENYDDGTPVPPSVETIPASGEALIGITPVDEKKAAYMKKAKEMSDIETVPAHGVKAFNEALHELVEENLVSPGEEVFNEIVDTVEEAPDPWELDDVLLVCSQCGRTVRVPPMTKVPWSCACGLIYDHDHALAPTEIVIEEPTTLVVRKMARKW